MEKPDYGNWVPQKVSLFLLLASTVSYLVTFIINIQLVVGYIKNSVVTVSRFFHIS